MTGTQRRRRMLGLLWGCLFLVFSSSVLALPQYRSWGSPYQNPPTHGNPSYDKYHFTDDDVRDYSSKNEHELLLQQDRLRREICGMTNGAWDICRDLPEYVRGGGYDRVRHDFDYVPSSRRRDSPPVYDNAHVFREDRYPRRG
ncbi:unnamed protein product [Cyprideis torosa]|uniref:Uncharacterized protein n=1 Tax=Cyprideis torosa TaxID=163714 RepID=A0A7R8W7S2_9CRUS|nr:unnamed protein product [Cyprideis torosa]CAG0886673.1 unnamed protein product [Cyprideis torosa]